MDDLTSKEIAGRTVIDHAGNALGTVSDVTLDLGQWRVKGLVVDLRREVAEDLHLDRGLFGGNAQIEVSPGRVESLGEHVLLNVDANEIAGMLRRAR